MELENNISKPKSPRLRQLLTGGTIGVVGAMAFGPGVVFSQENRMPEPISKESIAALDQKSFNLVREAKLPPTIAARLYAYLATYQESAVALASKAWGESAGDLNILSANIVAQLFPERGLEKHFAVESPDRMSTHLSDAIKKYSRERLRSELAGLQKYPILEGEQFWYGENPVTPEAGTFKPWYLDNNAQFRSSTPPLRGYMEDPRELEAVWNAVTSRTLEQESAIKFWAGGAGTETPGGIWLNILNERVMSDPSISLRDYLKMRTVLTGTIADAFYACWDTKYTYCVQRPIQCDPNLKDYLPIATPPFPSYNSGHSTISGAAAEVLAHFIPEEGFKYREMAVEASNSRLWAGIHFPIDCTDGLMQGRQIAQFNLKRV